MAMIDDGIQPIKGAEGILIHKNCILLGMQKPARWYTLPNDEQAAIIKTLGGQIEEEDKNSTKKALIREIMEEIKGIDQKDIRVSTNSIFSKKVRISDLNPYEPDSELSIQADFYVVKAKNEVETLPNDLPALVEIPISVLTNLQFGQSNELHSLYRFLIINEENNLSLPKYYALMIPEEVREVLKKIQEKESNKEDIAR